MKRLYKISFFFLMLLLLGIYFSIKSINAYFSSKETIEVVSLSPNIIKMTVKI
ncbi:MAG: hypothetical protein IBX66_07745 [Lutibacter sp.]|nr:hypothetical protein [Lutibacter sp.]